jgi:hypothetical protein
MKILLRFDDIAENMNWSLLEKCEELFDKYKIKPVLGIIPNNQDKELLSHPKKNNFWQLVKKWENKGWEISMHGYNHLYDMDTHKKDLFMHGGKSEFCGHTLKSQKKKIKLGLAVFKKNNVNVRSFFAPNHTYDLNTLEALKEFDINIVIDGYGVKPYLKHGIKFIPQLFYKLFFLPFGIQSTQIHLNYWKEKDFINFEKFIKNNYKNIITFDEVINYPSSGRVDLFLNFLLKKTLLFKRKLFS